MADRYHNFEELSGHEHEFQVTVLDRGSDVTIVAPHGGRIEPNTSDIAALIAGDLYNLFCFNGLKDGDNRDLHLTSHKFDHPRALALVSNAGVVVSVHGCSVKKPIVYLGGLDTALIKLISGQLTERRITNECSSPRLKGTHPHNICNRGRSNRGVQLEISRGVRDCGSARLDIGSAVQAAIELQKKTGRGKGVTSPVNARKNG